MGDEAVRWRRRHERERAARLEAEEIAERAIRDLYEVNRSLDARITERTRELAAALEEASAANRAKSTFLRGLAHELSTPLHAVKGLAKLIHEKASNPEVLDTARRIEAASERLHGTLRTLVEFSAVSGGELAVDPIDLTLADLADRMTGRWAQAALRKGVLLVVEARPSPEVGVFLDPARLEQIVDPLIDNAVVHGTGRVTVEIELGSPDHTLRVRVSDDGEGFAPDLRAHAFDAFVRGSGAPTDGLGIGLTLSQSVANAVGGHVRIVEGAGGACLHVELPGCGLVDAD